MNGWFSSNRTVATFSWLLSLALLLFAPCAEAQYRNPYTGQTHTNSYANMMDMTRTWNQSLFDAQNRLQDTRNQTGAIGSHSATTSRSDRVSSAPPASPRPHYPITATDFRPAPTRLMPDQLANAVTDITPEQRRALRARYHEFLATFEREGRKNNVATSFAFVIAVSRRVVNGQEVSEHEMHRLVSHFSDHLPAVPQFRAMSSREKQALYESLIITGGTINTLHVQGIAQNNEAMQLQAKEMGRKVLAQLTGSSSR